MIPWITLISLIGILSTPSFGQDEKQLKDPSHLTSILTDVKHDTAEFGHAVAHTTRDILGFSAIFLKLLLTGTETYVFALEQGAKGSSAEAFTSAGTAGLHSGSLQGILMGGVKLSVGLGMTNLITGAAILFTSLAVSAVVEQIVDKLDKSAVRISALNSVDTTQDPYKLTLFGNTQTFSQIAKDADRNRVKYQCKRRKAIKHAQKGRIKDALFCLWNNAAPMDYLCEFLGNLPKKKETGLIKKAGRYIRNVTHYGPDKTLALIAPIFRNALIDTYRSHLKYRFLDKYYTAIHSELEGMIKNRSHVNVADRLDASEYWHIDSKVSLGEVLSMMTKDSPLMRQINQCHKNGCDDKLEIEKDKEKEFGDIPKELEYENYCHYYFSKSPFHRWFMRKSANFYKKKLGFENTKRYDAYLAKQKEKHAAITQTATDNFNILTKQVSKLNPEEEAIKITSHIEILSQDMEKYTQLMQTLEKQEKSLHEATIEEWIQKNQDSYLRIKNARNDLIKQGEMAKTQERDGDV